MVKQTIKRIFPHMSKYDLREYTVKDLIIFVKTNILSEDNTILNEVLVKSTRGARSISGSQMGIEKLTIKEITEIISQNKDISKKEIYSLLI